MSKQRTITQPDAPLAQLGVGASALAAPTKRDTDILFSPPGEGDERLQNLPVSKLRLSPYNSRRIRTQKRIDKVAESMRTNGQKDPIYVYPGIEEDEGFYMVLGGETRRLSALKIGMVNLKAIVDRTLDPKDALLLTRISNILNDSVDECDLDRAMVAQSLLDQGHTHGKVAEALDVDSRQQVMRLLKLVSLPKHFVDFGQEYPERFSASVGGHIALAMELHGEEFAFSLLKSALIEETPHRKIEQLAREGQKIKLLDPVQGKRLRRDGGIDISVPDASGGKYAIYKSPTPGRMVLKLNVELQEAQAQELNNELTTVIQQFIENNNKQ
jgi:ParB/RepB/Spo0J family partition protein